MLERQVVISVSAEQLWDALTEPALLADWFGADVQWDLRPGGRARFVGEDGTVRGGVVDDVRPGRHLRFRWWPEDGDDAGPSQVSYDLVPEEDGTRLIVTEAPLPSSTSARAETTSGAGELEWSDWDTTMFRCWARLEDGPVRSLVSVVPAAR